ncbi:unnamed protein product [Urochloa humidicola]
MEVDEAAAERVPTSGGGDPDRLSALPDSLLHAIMSNLKARQTVQTCVLGRRWRHLWRSVPCLDVDHDEFRTQLLLRTTTTLPPTMGTPTPTLTATTPTKTMTSTTMTGSGRILRILPRT